MSERSVAKFVYLRPPAFSCCAFTSPKTKSKYVSPCLLFNVYTSPQLFRPRLYPVPLSPAQKALTPGHSPLPAWLADHGHNEPYIPDAAHPCTGQIAPQNGREAPLL